MATMIRPDFLAPQVRDLAASAAFYAGLVGLRPSAQSPPDAVVFDTRPIPFAVRRPLVDLDAAGGRLGWGVALWFACDDADGMHARLVGAGAEIVSALAQGPFGRMFTFRDPDGYAVTVHQTTDAPGRS